MLNLLAAERMKLKRNRLLMVCSIVAILLPALSLGGSAQSSLSESIFSLQFTCQLVVYPILSGFIITFLFQKEYGDHTIINNLLAPISRIKFLIGKLTIWGLWHITITICFLAIACVGVYFSYGETVFFENGAAIIGVVLKAGIFNLGTLLPVAWIAVIQRKTFYPSLFFTLIITALGFVGMTPPGLLLNLIPWTAVYQIIIPGREVINGVAYTSIIVCSALGFGLAAYSIKKQEL